jgi:hypothetical protein
MSIQRTGSLWPYSEMKNCVIKDNVQKCHNAKNVRTACIFKKTTCFYDNDSEMQKMQ